MKRVGGFLLGLLLTVSALPVSATARTEAVRERIPPQSHRWLITGENRTASGDTVELYVDREGIDFAVYQPATGKVWASAVDPETYTEPVYNEAGLSTFVSLTVLGNSSQETIHLYDRDKNASVAAVTYTNRANGITVHLALENLGIRLDVSLELQGDTLVAGIPKESIQEDGDYKLVAITLFPTFGAARGEQDGYLFFPDGSGSILELKPSEGAAYPKILPFYGEQEATEDLLATRQEQGLEILTCPVFGIKADDAALFGNVTAGSAEAFLYLAPGGYIYPSLYRSYVSFTVHRSHSYTDSSGSTQYIVDSEPIVTERAVQFNFLTGEQANYSGMATVYRTFLMKLRNRSPLQEQAELPLFLDLFMGAGQDGFLFRRFVPVTTFSQAEKIVLDLQDKGIRCLQVELLGWNKGGYAATPTSTEPARQLGGSRGLKNLLEVCGEQAVPVLLRYDSLLANTAAGSFNARKDAVRVYPGTIAESRDGLFRFLTGRSFLERYSLEPRKNLKRYPQARVSLGQVGDFLFYSYSKTGSLSREENLAAIIQGLDVLSADTEIAVAGGSVYAATRAGTVVGVPDDHSGYIIADRSVPFYQMVLHGWVSYTTTAGNRYYDFDRQVLRWAEMGAIPYFELTWDSSEKLRDTDYGQLFSSQYSLWSGEIEAVYQQFNTDFASLQNQFIVSHELLQENVVRVVYSDGTRVYVNYGNTAVQVDGVSLQAEQYRVVRQGEAS